VTLLVDIGNSRVKWGRLERDGRIVVGTPLTTDASMLGADLDRVWAGIERPPAIVVCNVAGAAVEAALAEWVLRHWTLGPQLIRTAREGFGVVNGYTEPGRLGVDRWVGLIGARAVFGVPACLIDCGTAVTVDLLDSQGRHRGGLIAPGLRLMTDALRRGTRGGGGIGGPAAGLTTRFWGQSTGEGLESGALQTAAGLVERAAQRARRDLGAEPTLVLTGGDASAISPLLSVPYRLAPTIVLQGLARFADGEGTRRGDQTR
jgi:type III pantothenate kinase